MSENQKIIPKDIYNELWRCRDFEISHMWQRSVFLATFMLAIAAGYGSVVSKIIFQDNYTAKVYKTIQKEEVCTDIHEEYYITIDSEQEIKKDNYAIQHFSAACLCYLGLCFSILWVMMSKGSKYWYECYEQSINAFITIAEKESIWDISYDYPRHGELNEPERCNSSIFSPHAYTYSVSKINCSIGIIGIICWLLLSIIHLGKTICFYWNTSSSLKSSLLSIGVSCTVFIILFSLLSILCKSGED